MANKPRDIGTKFETALVNFFKSVWPKVRRVGSRDYGAGDLEGVGSFCIEAKAEDGWGKAKVEKWLAQAEDARQRVGKKYKLLIVRQKYKSTGKAIVMMDADQWRSLVEEYGIK